MPKLAAFATEYPEVVLDITTSNDPVDIVAGGYDAGIQIGEYIERDMIAVRVSNDLRLAVFSPQGPLVFDDSELVVAAALRGAGIGTALESTVETLIASGRLVQVLQDWCPTFPGYYLYYPSRRNRPAALSALTRTLRFPG